MSDGYVDVRVAVRLSTYRELYAHARARGADVPTLLSRLADASLKPKQVHRPHVAVTDDMLDRATELRATGLSWREIGQQLGTSHTGIYRAYLKRANRVL